MHFHHLIHRPPGLTQLRAMTAEDRLPHANILLAPPGGGGLPAALAIAKLLLCENRQGDHGEVACGVCKACRKTAGYVHPDLHFAFPTVGSKMVSDNFLPQWREALKEMPYQEANDWLQRIGAENKQGNITRDECAAILRKLTLKIFEGRYKVMLIWLPEYLGDEGNRLLKMIEEPPENTVFLLVAERLELIINTILSRCQLTKLAAPTDDEITAGLQQLASAAPSPSNPTVAPAAPPEKLREAARLADGNFNLAKKLLEESEASYGPQFLDWLRKCYKGSAAELVPWVDGFAGIGRENQKNFLRYALHFWREFLLLSVLGEGESGVRLPPDELKGAKGLLKLVGSEQLSDIATVLSECTEHVERNANPKILFLNASVRIHRILRRPKAA